MRKGMPRTHHLHLLEYSVDEAREGWDRTRLFRDYLCVHPDDAREYEELKRDLARRFPRDRPAYEEHKTEFVRATLEKASTWRRAVTENTL